ncbi:CAP domain-containing protein [Anaerotruncus sp.]|jgi:uncharacterized protein YkwD|uniref:CAP domain-containing protein n=1 Tax=Anaerotruncus sp. TaxID=1872531 RepID=UPI00216BE211|nr:CAP domain-containing protein [Anaerotruncus sp.]MCI8493922.1 CAP domain-containing protein [Anaerotruncus sp.]
MKKIFQTILVTAMLLACTVTAHAAPSGLEGYPVTVDDWTTPAVFAAGKDWPITTWYLYAEDGTALGSISNQTVMELSRQHPTGSIQWETWLAEAFNEYRQISGFVQDSKAEGKEPVIGVGSLIESKEDFDAEALALEAFGLINEARTENGLHEVVLDEEAMELAKMRVPELEERYGHTRPDGTRMSQTYRCAEIINRRASTPQIAVESWLDSPAHREIILDERYHSAGVACRKGADGVTYWCMLFYK